MIDDQALIRAARKRILRELAGQQSAGSDTGHRAAGGGIMDRMGGAGDGNSDLLNYLVEIEKTDIPNSEPGGKPIGWRKKVRRFTEPKGKE